ncbi:recombinase family protein [Streptomyces sp. NPDC091387]|uniref:recombinase family protein n=1 Tax=Streptomyces sp. NPDC091387 TaxID=3365998 RepID=UPI00381BD4C8
MIERAYDGCGRCYIGVRRLSQMSASTSSPERQRDDVLATVKAAGGHVIAWADDWEVSGATDPMTRPRLGPWLRGERGPYNGIAGAAVDRLGRNLVDCLNTGYMMRDTGLALLTYGHDGPWNLDDPNDENRFTMEAWGAQMELRAIQRRNRDAAVKARAAGRVKAKPSYGYRYVRLVPTGAVDHVVLHEHAASVIRNVARRILADPENVTPSSEAARLTRAGELSPSDHRAVMYGRPATGAPWMSSGVRDILRSEAALGYLMHKNRPVIGSDGHPVRIAEPLWDRATHEALRRVIKQRGDSHPGGARVRTPGYLLAGLAFCGQCHGRLKTNGAPSQRVSTYYCNDRVLGKRSAKDCRPAPSFAVRHLEELVENWFLSEYGHGMIMETVFDAGDGFSERIAEVEAARRRLRSDREAGLFDAPDDAEWFRTRYADMGRELDKLRLEPVRPAGMVTRPTGETVEGRWQKAPDVQARREVLRRQEPDAEHLLHPGLDPPL